MAQSQALLLCITGLLSACSSVSGWDHHLHIVTLADDYDHCDSIAVFVTAHVCDVCEPPAGPQCGECCQGGRHQGGQVTRHCQAQHAILIFLNTTPFIY